ncbi:c-type cytochrome [Cupriavidus campinensis]
MPAPAWLDTLLACLQYAQLALLRTGRALGLTGDSHGQPAWPWARRIAGETLRIDPGLARQLAWSLAAVAFALLALAIALAWRRARLPWLGAGALALLLAPWPAPALLLGPAAPTSFHASPTRFAAASIARGERIYTQHCAACHGDDGRGEGPLAASLPRWPPTLAGPLLGRRADGDLFWHIAAGMHDPDGRPTMPAFGNTLGDAGIWAVIDYMNALAAGTGAALRGAWPTPLRLPEVTVRCGRTAPRTLADWRGAQRVRVVAFDGRPDALPMEDPRFLTLLITPDGRAPADVPQFRAGCVAASPDAWRVIAHIAGVAPAALPGTELLADTQGWLRARGMPGRGAWRASDLLCASGQPETPRQAGGATADALTALLLRMDAEPVRFIKGGLVH